jgi:hypothetical protein
VISCRLAAERETNRLRREQFDEAFRLCDDGEAESPPIHAAAANGPNP